MSKDIKILFTTFIDYSINTRGLSEQTIKGYREVFRHFTNLLPEVSCVTDVTQDAVNTFFKRVKTRKRMVGRELKYTEIKASTIRTYGSKLYTFFEWLHQRGDIESNPIVKKNLPTPDYSDKRALERQDVDRILSAITQYSQNPFILKRSLAMFSTMLYTGVRRNELLFLKVCDIDLEKNKLRVDGKHSKSKKTRQIPINLALRNCIEGYLDERKKRGCRSEYLWISSNRDERFTEFGLKHLVKKLNELSGVKFHVHRFRHTFATALGRQGASSIVIQKLMGHTDLRMTERYLRSMDVEDMRDDIDSLNLDSF